jgi:hypothetical protein
MGITLTIAIVAQIPTTSTLRSNVLIGKIATTRTGEPMVASATVGIPVRVRKDGKKQRIDITLTTRTLYAIGGSGGKCSYNRHFSTYVG